MLLDPIGKTNEVGPAAKGLAVVTSFSSIPAPSVTIIRDEENATDVILPAGLIFKLEEPKITFPLVAAKFNAPSTAIAPVKLLSPFPVIPTLR